ncbi:MAG: hypothetical protein MJY45_06140 [Bacteroidales bacterium]|nr:hypothetical protein [Bacteroidales bacterium]
MATTPVTLSISGYAEREVQMISFEFDQATGLDGQMSGIPRGGMISFRLKALNDGNSELCAWMLERSLPKDGKVVFLETRTAKKMKEINFKNAYCVNYQEIWKEGEGHVELLTITCKEIDFAGVKFTNQWK